MPPKTFVCPRCSRRVVCYPSLSRKDNQTDICDRCGMAEAFEDAGLAETYIGLPYWHVEKDQESQK